MLARGMQCGMVVTTTAIHALTDRDPGDTCPLAFPGSNDAHYNIVDALNRSLPLGGLAVLVDTDTDPDLLELSSDSGTSLIDPCLLKAQTGIEVQLVSPHRALAAAVRHGSMKASDIGRHTLERNQPFGLVQIVQRASEAKVSVSIIDASGQSHRPKHDFSCSMKASAERLVDILGHHLGKLLAEVPDGAETPGIVLYADSESQAFADALYQATRQRFEQAVHPLRLHTDPVGALAGALLLAQELASE